MSRSSNKRIVTRVLHISPACYDLYVEGLRYAQEGCGYAQD